ncbi:hypothetical protein K438DRAFT_2014395 [Mycena galopus ATCC 62051]|nr:hypothetical protein K438DRAFT_2014395 [Mycena galopus ATCC 62051]
MVLAELHNSIWAPDTSASPPHAHPLHLRDPLGRVTLVAPDAVPAAPVHLRVRRAPRLPLAPARAPQLGALAVGPELRRRPDHHPRAQRLPREVVRKRQRRLKAVVRVLEVIMHICALYTTMRYFLALALAALSLLSCAALLAALALPLLQAHNLGHTHAHNPTLTTLRRIRTALRHTASLLLNSNFALVFPWRPSPNTNIADSESLAGGRRCGLDIDVVWSIHPPSSPRRRAHGSDCPSSASF